MELMGDHVPCPRCAERSEETSTLFDEPGYLRVVSGNVSDYGFSRCVVITCNKLRDGCDYKLHWSSTEEPSAPGRLPQLTKKAIFSALSCGMGHSQFSEFVDNMGLNQIDWRRWQVRV